VSTSIKSYLVMVNTFFWTTNYYLNKLLSFAKNLCWECIDCITGAKFHLFTVLNPQKNYYWHCVMYSKYDNKSKFTLAATGCFTPIGVGYLAW
jgi:hypothetical protein